MNVGTEEIKHRILKSLKKHKAVLRGIRYGEFADDLTAEICGLFGGEMLAMDIGHDIPTEIIELIQKLERNLGGMKFKRDPESLDVYKWILEQPAGELQMFFKWATAPDRRQYVGKYRKSPGAIRFDWSQAQQQERIIRNEDGSLNV